MNKNNKKFTHKRIIAEVSEKLHSDIKTMAANRYITMRKYILRAVLKQLNEDKKYN